METQTLWNINNIEIVYDDTSCIVKSIVMLMNKIYIRIYLDFHGKYVFNISRDNCQPYLVGMIDELHYVLEKQGFCPITDFYVKVKFHKKCFEQKPIQYNIKYEKTKYEDKIFDISHYDATEIFPVEEVVSDFFSRFLVRPHNFKNAADYY